MVVWSCVLLPAKPLHLPSRAWHILTALWPTSFNTFVSNFRLRGVSGLTPPLTSAPASVSSICHFFELTSVSFVPYSLRRGGATYFYVLLNSLDFVVVRRRWKDVATACIYLDDARASLITMKLSGPSLSLLSRFRKPFAQLAFCFASGHEIGG